MSGLRSVQEAAPSAVTQTPLPVTQQAGACPQSTLSTVPGVPAGERRVGTVRAAHVVPASVVAITELCYALSAPTARHAAAAQLTESSGPVPGGTGRRAQATPSDVEATTPAPAASSPTARHCRSPVQVTPKRSEVPPTWPVLHRCRSADHTTTPAVAVVPPVGVLAPTA
ncbi:MAG TPA: hypothetical protein VET24_06100 [Actinomycetota bacterium]|nr:hypothetical protein [Actinomycetota bacterium]